MDLNIIIFFRIQKEKIIIQIYNLKKIYLT